MRIKRRRHSPNNFSSNIRKTAFTTKTNSSAKPSGPFQSPLILNPSNESGQLTCSSARGSTSKGSTSHLLKLNESHTRRSTPCTFLNHQLRQRHYPPPPAPPAVCSSTCTSRPTIATTTSSATHAAPTAVNSRLLSSLPSWAMGNYRAVHLYVDLCEILLP